VKNIIGGLIIVLFLTAGCQSCKEETVKLEYATPKFEVVTLESKPAEIDKELYELIEEEHVDYKESEPVVTEMSCDASEWYVITAYCSCYRCCGKTNGITASGAKATEGVTIAADTNKLPFGTRVYIEGVGERIVQDRGGAIKGNRIDLYFSDHQRALNFGRQTKQVKILN
jgi:3D (Asp-Asp-Asp) domain-containing protein